MADVNVNFVLGNDEPIRADFQLEPDVTYTADIMLSSASSFHNELYNRDLPDQHPMSAITGLDSALGDLETAISDEETRAKGEEQELAGGIESNHQAISDHVSNKNNPHEVTKAQVGLGNVDNTSDSDKPVSTATQTALDGKVDKTTTADRVYGTDSSGNQTTYDKGSFGQVDDVQVGGVSVVTNKIAELGTMAGETVSDYSTTAEADLLYATTAQGALADTALQPNDNISELNNDVGYITSSAIPTNYVTTDTAQSVPGAKNFTQINNANGNSLAAYNTIQSTNDIGNTSENLRLQGNGDRPRYRSGSNVTSFLALQTDIPTNYVTTDTAQTITGTKTFHNCAIESDNFITLTSSNAYVRYSGSGVVRSLLRRNSSGTVEVGSSNDTVKIQGSATRPAYNSSDLALYSDVTSGDNALQSQIDALVVASDVFDIVGTYAELQAYDISTVPVNDIIKVLVDSTHSGAATYYRCVESGGVKSWSYIGSEGAYYTKGEADNKFVPQTRTVNSKALSSDITLTASDVGALPDSTVIPTVNDATVTIQKNGSTVSTFTLNQSSNETVNLTVPTKTSDLTNDSGFITGIDSSAVTTALGYTPVNPSSLATVATSGSYTDLENTPTIPAAQVNSDWSADSGVAQILNKPTIPVVNNSTIQFTQGGVSKGSFTLNQSSGATIALDAGGVADIDGVTIDTNSSDELEVIGVIDNNGNAIKTWTGTLAQYNAIVTKDSNTLYNITDDMSVPQTILETLYPVGSLYIGKMSTCPLASLIPNSTWTLVASDKVLQGSGTYTAGTSVNAGLPNITGTLERVVTCTSGGSGTAVSKGTGAFSDTPSTAVNKTAPGSGSWWNDTRNLSFKASNSNSIYGKSTTVQPPAYVVNIWERTA